MLDLNKTMASKEFGKVVDYHLIPEWAGVTYRLICNFGGHVGTKYFMDNGYHSLPPNPDKDLYNIVEPALQKYWSKSSDVPMSALFVRYKSNSGYGQRSHVDICGLGLYIIKNKLVILVEWRDIKECEYWNGKEWLECRCEVNNE